MSRLADLARAALPPPLVLLLGAGLLVLNWSLPIGDAPELERGQTALLTQSETSSAATLILTREEPDPNELDVIWTRPVLAASRRPWAPPPPELVLAEAEPLPEENVDLPSLEEVLAEPEPPPPPPTAPELELLGVMGTRDGQRALVREASSSEETWIQEGASFGPWTVVEIRHDYLRLQAGLEEVLVRFRR